MERNLRKQEIRKQVYALRKSMTDENWKTSTQRITDRLIQTSAYKSAKEIYCYVDYNHEVGTRNIIENAWNSGKKVYVPKVLDREMEFYEIKDFTDLEPGTKGILEPKEDLLKMASGEGGIMILPGVAFDKSCHRIGYGGGFYDRYLAKHPSLTKIAIAFSYQIYEEIPWEEFDISPEMIITEETIYGDTP